MSGLGERALFALAGVIGALPRTFVGALARAGGALWWHVLRYRRRVILENLGRAFPEKTAAERRALGRAAAEHLTLALLELFRIPSLQAKGVLEDTTRLEGLEHLGAAKLEGKGVLILSGHLGSFELAMAAAARRAGPVHVVVKSFSAGFDAFITRLRTASGLSIIRAESAVGPILRALAKNEAVTFVLDQNATRKTGVFVDFFGTPASTMSALALLALRTGAPVVPAIPFREGGGHVLRMLPEVPLEVKGDREETIRHMTGVYTRVLEQAIREHPAEWFWTHKRWRTRPKVEASGVRRGAGGG